MEAGYKAGVFAEIPLNDNLFFAPEINYVNALGKYSATTEENNNKTSLDRKTELRYLEVPLNITGKIDAGKGKVLLGAGPYLGFVLGGKTRQDIAQSNPASIAGFEFYKEDIYKPAFIGANILAGYELPIGLKISAQANHSLSNLDKRDNNKMQSFYAALSVGYKF